jgi:hypothetical protein
MAPTRRFLTGGAVLLLTAVTAVGLAVPAPAGAAPPVVHPAAADGSYAVIDRGGGVLTYGGAAYDGDTVDVALAAPVVGAAAAPGGGYWLAAADGGVFAFGHARFLGSMGGRPLTAPVVGLAADPSGGYWLVAADGGVFAFGAPFLGSMGGRPLTAPVVGLAADPSGGYWLVAADGGVFAFGAPFLGSMGGRPLTAPVVGLAPSPTGRGYAMAGTDGGVFAFGDAPYAGSMGGRPLSAPVAALALSPDGRGYWMVGQDDAVYAFGDAAYAGGGGSPMHPPLYPAVWSPAPEPAVALLPLAPGPSAPPPGPARVLLVGDSLSWDEAYDTAAARPAYQVENGATPGCGVDGAAPSSSWRNPTQSGGPGLPACDRWTEQFDWAVRRYHPAVVDLQVGFWETRYRLFDGAFVTLADPGFAQEVGGELARAVGILHELGAEVLVDTCPYFGDGTPDWNVDDFNALVHQVVGSDSAFAAVLDVNRILDPGGTYTATIDGVTVRGPDGVHLSPAGVQDFLDPALAQAVTAAG